MTTYKAHDQDDEKQMESDVDGGEYTKRCVVAILGVIRVRGATVPHASDHCVPNTDTAENAHRTEDVLVLLTMNTHTHRRTHIRGVCFSIVN